MEEYSSISFSDYIKYKNNQGTHSFSDQFYDTKKARQDWLNSEEYKINKAKVIERWKALGLLDEKLHKPITQIFSELDPYGEENWGE